MLEKAGELVIVEAAEDVFAAARWVKVVLFTGVTFVVRLLEVKFDWIFIFEVLGVVGVAEKKQFFRQFEAMKNGAFKKKL